MKLPEIRMMSLDKIDINPYRNLSSYPLIRSKIDALKASFNTVGVWPSIVARSAPDGRVQQAFGHQRMQAARELDITEVPIIVSALTDEQMVQYMGRENGEDYSADFLIMLNTWEAGRKYLSRPEISGKVIKDIDIARLLGWTEAYSADRVDQMNQVARACSGAYALIEGGYLARGDLAEVSVSSARYIVDRAVRRMESIDRSAKLSGAATKDVEHAKSMVGKGVKATVSEVRQGTVPASQIAGRVDVNAFKAAGRSKVKDNPLFPVFGHALAESISKMLATDVAADKLAEIAKVVNQVVDEEDRRILQRIDFELEAISDRATGWRKRLTPNKVKPFPAAVQIGGDK